MGGKKDRGPGLDAEGKQLHVSWGRMLPADLMKKLEEGQEDKAWYKQGFRVTMDEEAGMERGCMLQCSKCTHKLSAG